VRKDGKIGDWNLEIGRLEFGRLEIGRLRD
jgi:hypothetical protein